MSVVKTVAGLVVLDIDEVEEDAVDDNAIAALHKSVERAEKALTDNAIDQYRAPSTPSGDWVRRGPFTLPVLWPHAPGVQNAKPGVHIGEDISRFLAVKNIPTTFGKNDELDVSDFIAEAMFANSDTHAKLLTVDNVDLFHVGFNIEGSDKSVITGGHVYYKIPLGNPGTHAAWHSALVLYTLFPASAEKALKERRRELAPQLRKPLTTADGNFNPTTVSVTWNRASGTAVYMSKAINGLSKTLIYLPPSIVEGTKYTYQFQSATDVGPADVLTLLSTAIHGAVSLTQDHPLPTMPSLRIENMCTFIQM